MTLRTDPPGDFLNPLLAGQYRRPDWRFILAQQYGSDSHQDPAVDRLLKCYYKCNWKFDPEVDAVVRLHKDYRINIAAMILGSATDDIISNAVGSVPEVISLYRTICFEVYPDDPVFKKEKAANEYSTSPKERQVLMYALVHGWELYIRGCGKTGKAISDQYSRITDEVLREQALRLAQHKFAEQELAPISSPLFQNDGLLRVVLNGKTESKKDTSLEDEIKTILRGISDNNSKDKIEFKHKVEQKPNEPPSQTPD